MLDQELEVSIRARRWACVVDPMLAFVSPLGAQLVQRLSTVMELWMVRTFWQVLDSSDFYRRDPLAFWPADRRDALRPQAPQIVQALCYWEGLRARTDMAGCGLRWVSDNLSESSLPEGAPPDLIERYESLHQSLSLRADPHLEATETAGFFGAMDTLSLCAALGSARVLTLAATDPCACLPTTCALLSLPVQAPPAHYALLAEVELQQFNALLSHAGASALAWSGPPLAMAYTVLPCAVLQNVDLPEYGHRVLPETLPMDFDEFTTSLQDEPAVAALDHDHWQDARLFLQALSERNRGE